MSDTPGSESASIKPEAEGAAVPVPRCAAWWNAHLGALAANGEWAPEHLRSTGHLSPRQAFSHVLDATWPTTTRVLELAQIMSEGSVRG